MNSLGMLADIPNTSGLVLLRGMYDQSYHECRHGFELPTIVDGEDINATMLAVRCEASY